MSGFFTISFQNCGGGRKISKNHPLNFVAVFFNLFKNQICTYIHFQNGHLKFVDFIEKENVFQKCILARIVLNMFLFKSLELLLLYLAMYFFFRYLKISRKYFRKRYPIGILSKVPIYFYSVLKYCKN